LLYFDHNATHPLSATAKKAWLDAVERFPANPSSPHRLGQRAERALDDARARLAQLLGAKAESVIFTSGATEANNMVLAAHRQAWISAVEHPCVLESVDPNASRLPVDHTGTLDLKAFRHNLTAHRPSLVAMMAANNETGVLQPWAEVAEACKAANVPYLCDAAQWVGKLPTQGLDEPDFVTGCAHKFGGPVGVGFLVAQRPLPPLLKGGPQEEGRRAGTENLPGILAMVAALEERSQQIAKGGLDLRLQWRSEFETELRREFPAITILGDGGDRLWNTVSVLMPEVADCRRRWVVVMDKMGLAVSTGSACASGKEKPSHVLTAMGVPPDAAGRAIRFSAGWETTREDWHRLLEGVNAAVREMGRT
jgi:cysteine desulfurase